MSIRTKESKGKLKPKTWKKTLKSFYEVKQVKSAGGTVYENIVPYYKVTLNKKEVKTDFVNYLNRFFHGLF